MHSFISLSRFNLLVLLLVLVTCIPSADQKQHQCASTMIRHKQVFKQAFELGPGECTDRFTTMDEFPTGHIGIKSYWAEIVDENDVSVPISEVYIHHFTVLQYYINPSEPVVKSKEGLPLGSAIIVRGNEGLCKAYTQFFGVGAETRNSVYQIPGDYAVEIGKPSNIPPGFTPAWYLQVHAMSIKGTEDPFKCLECLCDLYNVTTDPWGNPIPEGYKGGYLCCYHGTRCRVAEGYAAPKKKYYFKYIVEWVDWDDECLSPVRTYALDATDARDGDLTVPDQCQAEYFVPHCPSSSPKEDCVHVIEHHYAIPKGGKVLFANAHNHVGGLGITVHGEDGRLICASDPVYGNGTVMEAGNEGGYVVAMTECYPQFGSVVIKDNERLLMKSYYKSDIQHTGVMSIFTIVIADDAEDSGSLLTSQSDGYKNGLNEHLY